MQAATRANLPKDFRRIRLELAREAGHPEGSRDIAYEIIAPLDRDGRIEPDLWRKHQDACLVKRMRPNQDAALGSLARRPGGAWTLHFEREGRDQDEPGYRFSDHAFLPGEYVSISEEGALHTFRVAGVQPL